MIFLISFSKFTDVLPASTCERAIGNLWNICLRINISRLEWPENLAMRANWATHAKFEGGPIPFFCYKYS